MSVEKKLWKINLFLNTRKFVQISKMTQRYLIFIRYVGRRRRILTMVKLKKPTPGSPEERCRTKTKWQLTDYLWDHVNKGWYNINLLLSLYLANITLRVMIFWKLYISSFDAKLLWLERNCVLINRNVS